ncbi:MAG: hypothetical protein RR140_03230 [Clostridia bacterium]
MNFSQLIIFVLTIFVLFNVFESVNLKLGIKKWYLFLILIIFGGLTFVPNFQIYNFNVSCAGFIFPCVLFFIAIFKLSKNIWQTFVGILFTCVCVLILKSIKFNLFENLFISPIYFAIPILTSLLFLICKKTAPHYLSLFLGATLADVLMFLTREDYVLILGDNFNLSLIIIGMTTCAFYIYCTQKIKNAKSKSKSNPDVKIKVKTE